MPVSHLLAGLRAVLDDLASTRTHLADAASALSSAADTIARTLGGSGDPAVRGAATGLANARTTLIPVHGQIATAEAAILTHLTDLPSRDTWRSTVAVTES